MEQGHHPYVRFGRAQRPMLTVRSEIGIYGRPIFHVFPIASSTCV